MKKKIFTLAGAHLDTTWLWDFETSIREYIPATLKRNFELFEKFPEYTFGFEGTYRYELMEEYYPEDFEKLNEYVEKGRWVPLGSCYENGDVNQPSPEALFRNILYGNDYFEKKFGKPSNDIYLPDCFGFGYALPSIMRHAGLKGFSTQKLTWGSATGTPFDLGKWYGVDGNFVYANTNPESYSRNLYKVREEKTIKPKLEDNIKNYDLPVTAAFYGTGDRGGAPSPRSVKAITNEMKTNGKEDIEVLSSTSVELFEYMDNELSDEQKSKLPTYDGELLMTNHGAGSYTSRAVGSRWNKNGERLADVAERSLVAAGYLKGHKYPDKVLETAWKRVIAHHFHDDITGTSFQECYKRNWNDYILSQKQFSEEYIGASKSIASMLDTSFAKGTAVVINNPTQYERKEAVSVEIKIDGCVRVFDSDKKEVPSYSTGSTVCFMAEMKPFSYKVYDIRKADTPYSGEIGLSVTENTLENKYIKVTFDSNGDISEIYHKEMGMNMLSDKLSLAIFDYKGSKAWPAWELTFNELMVAPREYARNPKFEIIEASPVRCTIKLTRTAGKSKFEQYISLDAESEMIKVYNEVDWRSTASLLKVSFPLAASNEKAAYDLGLGYVKRGNNTEKQYEVPAQIWADITNADDSFGVSLFSDSRTGWDKPCDNTLRLTVVHTPVYPFRWETSQHLMDLGINRFSFGVYCHKGKLDERTQTAAQCFNYPLNSFIVTAHKGEIKNEYSFAKVSDNSVIVRALKKAQNSDEIIVRFNEGENLAKKDVVFEIGEGIESAYEVYASEKYKADAKLEDGKLIFDMNAFEVKTFALKLKKSTAKVKGNIKFTKLDLPYNFALITENNSYTNNYMLTIPREIVPEEITCGGVEFSFGKDKLNAVISQKQEIELPKKAEKAYILATSLKGDKNATFVSGEKATTVKVSDFKERVGAWDLIGLKEMAYIKPDSLAWNATHAHLKGEDVLAKQLYIFKYEIALDGDKLILPDDKDIIIFAVTVSDEKDDFTLASELYDKMEKRRFDYEISAEDLRKASPALFEKVLDKFIDRRKTLIIDLPMFYSTQQVADIYSQARQIFDKT